jgi:hypothetical protein
VKSLLFSVPSQGNYSIQAFSDGLMGVLETSGGLYSFDVSSYIFISEVSFSPRSSPTLAATQTRSRTVLASPSVNFHSRTSEIAPPASESLSGGTIAVIVAGSVVVVGAVVAGAIFVLKKSKVDVPSDTLLSSQNPADGTSNITGRRETTRNSIGKHYHFPKKKKKKKMTATCDSSSRKSKSDLPTSTLQSSRS